MQAQRLLAVQDATPVDAGGRVLHPEGAGGQHHGQGRQRGEAARRIFVDVAQVAAGSRIADARAEAERVEDGVARRVGLRHRRQRPAHELVGIDHSGR